MKLAPTRRIDPHCRYGTDPTCVTDCAGSTDQAVVHLGRTTGQILARHRACQSHIWEFLVRTRWSGTRNHTRIDPYPIPTTPTPQES